MLADLDNDLLVLLADVSRHIRTYGDYEAQSLGLTRAQLIILVRLERQPDVSQNELAALADVTAATIARLIDRLEELGLVERSHDPEDRRIWRLRVTPAATSLMHEIDHFRAKLDSVLTEGISPAVRKAMIKGLCQMKENVTSRLTEEI
jgi:MarR family transcriptional regulator for hemolysin